MTSMSTHADSFRISFPQNDVELAGTLDELLAMNELLTNHQVEHYVHRRAANSTDPESWMLVAFYPQK